MEPVLIVHGGAGHIIDARVQGKFDGMKTAVRIGFRILKEEDNPLRSVERAVNVMENLPAFNAGYGSVLTATGEVEMDAMIINGTDLSAGAVGAVRHIANPISLARLVMDKTQHVFLAGVPAEDFAKKHGVALIPTRCLIPPQQNAASLASVHQPSKTTETYFDVGTVGAVAMNSKGQIAVATSTGGLSKKMDGRVGDTPILGGGTFGDDAIGGMSATGIGEAIMRANLCSRIAHLMQTGLSPTDAGKAAVDFMASKIPGSSAGVIIISPQGEVAYPHNSSRMAWAYTKGDMLHYGINQTEDLKEPLGDDPVPFPPPPKPDCLYSDLGGQLTHTP